jgi:hypothetical protein
MWIPGHALCLQDIFIQHGGDDVSFESYTSSKPLLIFDTPGVGVVAFNHPDKNNGGSSKFLGLQPDTVSVVSL